MLEVLIKYLNENSHIGIKGGRDREKFTCILMVNIEDRFFSRSWNKSARSWFTEFVEEGVGQIQFDQNIVYVKGQKVNEDDKIHSKINSAYLGKYNKPQNLKYSEGITQPEYARYTMEFILME